MAQQVFSDCMVVLNATVITSSVKSVKVNYTPDMLDNTVMGDGGKRRKKGMDDYNVELQLLDDFANAALDQSLWTLCNGGSTFALTWRPTTAIRGGGNPEYGIVGIIESHPMGGAVGELAQKTVRILCCGSSMTRTTTAT